VYFRDFIEVLFGREEQGGASTDSMDAEKFGEAHEHFSGLN
jgi:protein-disulfide isomerase